MAKAKGIGAALLREARSALPPTLFFLAAFNVLALTVALLGDGAAVSFATHAKVTFGALIAGKAVLIADRLPFFNRYPDKPLVWNVAWKAALYVAVAATLRLIERAVSEGFPPESFDWPRFWAILLWLAILFLTYSAFREAVGVIGRERALAIFLAPPDRRG
ncbi:MAG: hypothetical protein ACFCUS_08850 [Rubrimonas sp.]